MRRILLSSLIIFGFCAYLYSATGTPNNLIVRTDANNYLLVTSVTQTNPVTQGIFSSRTLRTDSNGSLQVVLTGTVTPTYPQAIPASTCAAPSLGESGAATTGIAFTATPSILMCIAGSAIETITGSDVGLTGVTQTITRTALTTTSTDGLIVQNTTAATVGTPVQISPRERLSGRGWDVDDAVSRTVSFFTETLPASGNTVSGFWKLGYIDPVTSAITYPFIIANSGSIVTLGSFNIGAAGFLRWEAKTELNSTSNALLNVTNSGNTIGIQLNTGTAEPTLSSCSTGTVLSGSRNTAGSVTATGATSCTVVFGAPAWTNTPFCVATDGTGARALWISSPSTTAFTVNGLTAGDVFRWVCVGRI